MIERLGFTLDLNSGVINYVSSNPIVYQGSQYEYYMDFDFLKNGERVLFDNDIIITAVFRRPDGNVSSPLKLERETENGEGTFSIFSILLKSNWFFYKAGNLAFTLTVKKIINAGEEDETEQILSTANGYINVVASADFDVSAPIPPSAYTEIQTDIQTLDTDLDALTDRVTENEGQIDNLKDRVTGTENRLTDIETANPVTSLTNFEATTSEITFDENHLNGSSAQKTIAFPSELATEAEAESIASTAVNTYDSNTVQPKFNQIDTELDKKVEYVNIEETSQASLEVLSATNVTTYIAGKNISDIFETNGTTAKNATNVTTKINNVDINDIFFFSGGTAVANVALRSLAADTYTGAYHLYRHYIELLRSNYFYIGFEVISTGTDKIDTVDKLKTALNVPDTSSLRSGWKTNCSGYNNTIGYDKLYNKFYIVYTTFNNGSFSSTTYDDLSDSDFYSDTISQIA